MYLDLVKIFKNYLDLNNKIAKKTRSTEKEKKYFHIQFGDKNFYEFLEIIDYFTIIK